MMAGFDEDGMAWLVRLIATRLEVLLSTFFVVRCWTLHLPGHARMDAPLVPRGIAEITTLGWPGDHGLAIPRVFPALALLAPDTGFAPAPKSHVE